MIACAKWRFCVSPLNYIKIRKVSLSIAKKGEVGRIQMPVRHGSSFCVLLKERCKNQTQRPVTMTCSVSRRNGSLGAVTTVITVVKRSGTRIEIGNGMDGQIRKPRHGINMSDAALVWCLRKASGQAEPIPHQTYIRPVHTLSLFLSLF